MMKSWMVLLVLLMATPAWADDYTPSTGTSQPSDDEDEEEDEEEELPHRESPGVDHFVAFVYGGLAMVPNNFASNWGSLSTEPAVPMRIFGGAEVFLHRQGVARLGHSVQLTLLNYQDVYTMFSQHLYLAFDTNPNNVFSFRPEVIPIGATHYWRNDPPDIYDPVLRNIAVTTGYGIKFRIGNCLLVGMEHHIELPFSGMPGKYAIVIGVTVGSPIKRHHGP